VPYVIIDNTEQVTLPDGTTTVGTALDAKLRLPGSATPGVQAVLEVTPSKRVTIRLAVSAAVVHVNGAPLGAEPASLSHGDRITVAGHDLLYGEERKSGSTQHISRVDDTELVRIAQLTPSAPSANTGGRLVSLVDGREHPVSEKGLVVGRDASCDVVLTSKEVSRRHAQIAPTDRGYVLTDLSRNGVFVNGARVEKSKALGVGDLVRIGNEVFRFFADKK
jgi:pSer/pThr/pTyr-binding forkhead associated (FHA) protein